MSTWGLHSAANKLYENLFPIYRPLYSAYKTCTDRAERELLRKILFPGAVVVDVGANIGIYSKFLSRCVGPTGLVHSFEPSADNFRRLRAATRKLSNVRLSQAAVGERSGESKLYVSNRLNVDHRMYKTDGDSHRPVRAEMVALDDYFKPGQRVDLIKMDIQGYELHALRGANRVVQENPDIKLLFEFWPHGLKQAGASWIELIDALQTKNMSVFQITTRGVVPFRSEFVSEAPDCYMNLFASSE
jgi:FkbM family methyltransferase